MIIVLYTAQHVPFASTAKHSALRSRHRSYVHVYNVICNTNIETLNSLYNQTEKSHFRRKWNSDYQIRYAIIMKFRTISVFCFVLRFFFRVKQECGRYGESFRVPISFATQAISNIIDSFLGKTWLQTTIACLFYCLRKEPYLSYIWFLLNMNNSFFRILLDV